MVLTRAQARAAGVQPLKLADILLKAPRTPRKVSATVASTSRGSYLGPRVGAKPQQSPRKTERRSPVKRAGRAPPKKPLPPSSSNEPSQPPPLSRAPTEILPSSGSRSSTPKRGETPNAFDFNHAPFPGWVQEGGMRRLLIVPEEITPAEQERASETKKAEVFDDQYDKMLSHRESRMAWYERMVKEGLENAGTAGDLAKDGDARMSEEDEILEYGDIDMLTEPDEEPLDSGADLSTGANGSGSGAHSTRPLVLQPTVPFFDPRQQQFAPRPAGVPTTRLIPSPTEIL